jgi:glycine betaine/choline ABC-type transport system substrate-binding protein
MMISLNGDKSWTMFDFIKRDGGCPQFIQKYSTPFEPTWIETLDNNVVLVAGYDPALAIYRIKG